jgi:hypothetical protein
MPELTVKIFAPSASRSISFVWISPESFCYILRFACVLLIDASGQ